ncbi:MAG: hypothetical protein OEO83_09310 [Alphaproteobacteria bacterium]|nr:hypothetical protein [Alphaproteobacteria bacterium]
MADDDRKDDAKDAAETKKTPVAEAARARTTSTGSAGRQPASANADAKPGQDTDIDTAGKTAAPDKTGGATSRDQTGDAAGPKLPASTAALAVVFAVVILVVILIAWPGGRGYIAGLFSGPEEAGRAELVKRLGALEGTLARIENDISALKAGGTAQGDLEKRVTALESRPGTAQFGEKLEQSDKRLTGLAATVAALDARIAKAEAAQSTGTVAVMALAGALRTGAPFAGLAERVTSETVGQGEVVAALKPLAPFAEAGVPTAAALMARLDRLELPASKPPPPDAASDSAPEPDPGKPAGFWDKVKTNIMKLGRIRKSPARPAGMPALETIRAATAEALVRGDLIAAAETAKTLPGDAAADWRRDLEARIKANAAASVLDLVIAARLGTPKGQR